MVIKKNKWKKILWEEKKTQKAQIVTILKNSNENTHTGRERYLNKEDSQAFCVKVDSATKYLAPSLCRWHLNKPMVSCVHSSWLTIEVVIVFM